MTMTTKIDWTPVMLTDEEVECIRVCLTNAPIPYDISKKNIPKKILERIGYPTPLEGETLPLVECDLSKYKPI